MLLSPSAGHGQAASTSKPCEDAFVARVRAPVSADDRVVRVACDLSLRPDDVITKQLVFEGPKASGRSLACHGAQLQGGRGQRRHSSLIIRSKRKGDRYAPVTDVTISDCRVEGGVRIHGMGDGGADKPARASSRRAGHRERSRAAAPRRIRLQRLHLQSVGTIPLYIAQGVTRVTLVDSLITGRHRSVAIYLDAESGFNRLVGNTFASVSERREFVAVDGSSDNWIAKNLFRTGPRGGVYLYRNCGERGTVRHNRPERNRVMGNMFLYEPDGWDDPAVFIGSRDGAPGYCGQDDMHPLGSGDSDLDFARDNVVANNTFVHRPVADAVATNNPRVNSPNLVRDNRSLDRLAVPAVGLSSCIVPGRLEEAPLASGQVAHVAVMRGGRAQCVQQRCEDGSLIDVATCTLAEERFFCTSAAGTSICPPITACRDGQRPIAAAAACNLRRPGPIERYMLRALSPGQLSVVDGASQDDPAHCLVGETRVGRLHAPIRAHSHPMPVGCQPIEGSAGCAVEGVLYCLDDGSGAGEPDR